MAETSTERGQPPPLEGTEPANERQTRRWEARREFIVREAVALVGEVGLDGLTLEGVGQRVGLSTGSLYYYFKGKDGLLAHVVLSVTQRHEEVLASQIPDAAGPEEILRLWCLAHLRTVCLDPVGRLGARVAISGIRDETVRRPLRAYNERLEALLRRGMDEGVFREFDTRVARSTIVAALNAVAIWYQPGGALPLDEIGEQVTDMIIEGLRAPGKRRRRPS